MVAKKIIILYFSVSGTVRGMAEHIAEGSGSVDGIDVEVRDIDGFDVNDLPDYDGIAIGSPSYFGNMTWQMKRTIDKSIEVFGMLPRKIGAVFTSAGSERDALRAIQALEWALLIHGLSLEDRLHTTDRADKAVLWQRCRELGVSFATRVARSAASS